MTNAQLYLAIGVPLVVNTAMIGLLMLHINARFDDMNARFTERFEDLKDLWRAELHRVEEVIDARLKHLEESR